MQETEKPDNSYKTELSQSESYMPLSPVLGCGQFRRHILKNRKRQAKGPKKVVQKLEDALKSANVSDYHENVTEQEENGSHLDIGLQGFRALDDNFNNSDLWSRPSNLKRLESDEGESVLERIKNLEALEQQKCNIIKSISLHSKASLVDVNLLPAFNKNEDVMNLENTIEVHCDNPISISAVSLPTSPIHFQTGTGKNINISSSEIEKCTKLFEDILCPSASQSSRKMKYNYLRRKSSFGNEPRENSISVNNPSIQGYIFSGNNKLVPCMHTQEKIDIEVKRTECDNLINLDQKVTARSKNIFNENFDDLDLGQDVGFKPASVCFDKTPHLDSDKLDIVVKETTLLANEESNSIQDHRFKSSSASYLVGDNEFSNSINLPETNTEAKKHSRNINELKIDQVVGFKSASFCLEAKQETTVTTPTTSTKNIYKDDTPDKFNNSSNYKLNQMPERPKLGAKKSFRNIFEGENFDDLNLSGINLNFGGLRASKPKGLLLKQSSNFQSALKTPAKSIAHTVTKNYSSDFKGFSRKEQDTSLNISSSHGKIVELIIKYGQIKLSDIEHLSKSITSYKQEIILEYKSKTVNRKRKFSEVDSDHNSISENASTSVTPLQSSFLKRPKKRLGCPFSPTIQISETVLKRAKLMFDDCEPGQIKTSTPLKSGESFNRPPLCDLTPIQYVQKQSWNQSGFSKLNYDSVPDLTLMGTGSKFNLNKPSEGDVKGWLEKLAHERHLLEEQLKIFDEKQTILNNQKTILEFSERGKNRVIPGVLFRSKNSRKCRVPLQKYLQHTMVTESGNTFFNQINPQNAHLVHFCVCDKRKSHIKTEDGAIIVPNINSRIGVSEIEHSFKVLEGVDPSLIPKGWVRNHYKWIVWKLASYDRNFEGKFEECLSVENVVQQLKYRYDIEIDQAKRPALRKIFEKDDCSQKRIILCVSKIMKMEHFYELELTDGWYPIRTVIDLPLCDQILKEKIKLGVKLIIYGAEIINCDGCHPLEAPDLVYLRINYNSTRRALPWCKLGYQKEAGPFLIPLSSINMEGGQIGCIRCYILRVYPVKYMEKCGDKNVWRNEKAEERTDQEFHNKKLRNLERLECYEPKRYLAEKNYKNIKNIEDPAVLYEMLHQSGDPEGLEEMLTSSQRTILYNYTISKSSRSQSSGNFSNCRKPIMNRSVTPMLKIKIVDASCNSDKVHDFYVWRPGEGHLQELKEGEIVSIFNVSCSSKWGLSANARTKFQRATKSKDERFQKFRRKVTGIGELPMFMKQKRLLNEFDMAGLVIEKRVSENQQVWMADVCGNLIAIRINNSPKNILALDTISEGQIVSACNLMLKRSCSTHCFALADHSVIFARYSQHKHLQDALEKLEEDFQNVDRVKFTQDCKRKILQIEAKWDEKNPDIPLEMDDMDCSQITTTDMALLECVDKLT